MRRSLFALPLLCLSLALAGCENMDPAYWIPDNKKKLPGERREVFPKEFRALCRVFRRN